MGAWGTGNLENDQAMDFAADLADDGDADTVESALKAVTEPAAAEQVGAPGVDRVAQPGSELRRLWFEQEDERENWTRVLDDLRARLVG